MYMIEPRETFHLHDIHHIVQYVTCYMTCTVNETERKRSKNYISYDIMSHTLITFIILGRLWEFPTSQLHPYTCTGRHDLRMYFTVHAADSTQIALFRDRQKFLLECKKMFYAAMHCARGDIAGWSTDMRVQLCRYIHVVGGRHGGATKIL